MPRTEQHERARARAEAKYGFFVHALVYAAVMTLLIVVDVSTSPGTVWFVWPLIGWGLALSLHGAQVFLLADRNTIVDAMTERELQRARTDERDKSL